MSRARTAAVNPSIASLERSLNRLARLAEPRSSADHDDACCALDRAAYTLLARIEEFGVARLTELAQLVGIDISTASRQVRALELRGLVARSDVEGDQRTRTITLSDDGRRALDAVRAARRLRLARRVEGWSAEDVTELAELLERFVASFTECDGGIAPAGARVARELQQSAR